MMVSFRQARIETAGAGPGAGCGAIPTSRQRRRFAAANSPAAILAEVVRSGGRDATFSCVIRYLVHFLGAVAEPAKTGFVVVVLMRHGVAQQLSTSLFPR